MFFGDELVAADAPAGFGIKVGKTTLCRYYKANFREIDALRRQHLQARSLHTVDDPHDGDYRYVLRHSTAQLLLERLWELLSRPVQSADELKKLAAIAEKLNSVDMDKQDENDSFQDSLLQMFARPARPAAASGPAPSSSAVAPPDPGTKTVPHPQA